MMQATGYGSPASLVPDDRAGNGLPPTNTLADSMTPYSKCTTAYTVGLLRKLKSCDQKHGCLFKGAARLKYNFVDARGTRSCIRVHGSGALGLLNISSPPKCSFLQLIM